MCIDDIVAQGDAAEDVAWPRGRMNFDRRSLRDAHYVRHIPLMFRRKQLLNGVDIRRNAGLVGDVLFTFELERQLHRRTGLARIIEIADGTDIVCESPGEPDVHALRFKSL